MPVIEPRIMRRRNVCYYYEQGPLDRSTANQTIFRQKAQQTLTLYRRNKQQQKCTIPSSKCGVQKSARQRVLRWKHTESNSNRGEKGVELARFKKKKKGKKKKRKKKGGVGEKI